MTDIDKELITAAYTEFPHAKIDEPALEYRERVLDWFENHCSILEDLLSFLHAELENPAE